MNFGISPVIRGWKYGLHSGFPSYTKAFFRRDRFGQFRDMLEQRHFVKSISDQQSQLNFFESVRILDNSFASQNNNAQIGPGQGPVEVKFQKQSYSKDAKGIGYITYVKTDPEKTFSYNLSTEVTSSVPYIEK
jgi:hypothetical protein